MSEPITEASLKVGSIAGDAITNTTAGTAHTVLTLTRRCRLVNVVSNVTGGDVMVTVNGVDACLVPRGGPVVIPLVGPFQYLKVGDVIGAYKAAGTPAANTYLSVHAS